MSYHYVESGLDNVYLENGYQLHDTPYGRGVSIQDTEGLHKLIGRMIIDAPCPINGAELRFIRLELEQTQRSLAAILGVEEQALRRWEKYRNKPINGAADRLLRALYSEYTSGDGSLRARLDRLAELDCIDKPVIRLREASDHWQPIAA